MIKLRHLFLAGVAALALTPVIARAGGDEVRSHSWAHHGNWDIRVFQDGHCYASSPYQYNQLIRIGVNGPENYYIMIGSPGVETLRPAEGWPVSLRFDNGQTYNGKASVSMLESGDGKVLEIPIGSHLMHSFMVAQNMYIHARVQDGSWKLVAAMDLTGTYNAMLKAAECTVAHGGSRTPSPRNNNPFYGA
jgi:hypothetical protein